MRNRLYWKLALSNLTRNRQMYYPYAIATAIMSAMFFMITNMVFSESIANVSWGGTLQLMLRIGLTVMGLFTVGYMIYLNSFLIKRRKKEFGLYGVLGLEKRHVAKIVRRESLLLNGAALLAGLLSGTVFGRLLFMLLMRCMRVAEGSVFALSPAAYALTAAVFCGIFLVNTIYNQFQVRLANPIDLINGEKQSEKRVRGAVPLTILGVLCIGAAYGCSLWVRVGAVALTIFWPAVLLVIAGTYCLFVGGSQTVLRALQKNERFYYRPGSFISVSGLSHRMKQNASGLANICILATMVVVTVSGVCALYFGQDDIVRRQNPNDYTFTAYYDLRLERPDVTESLRSAQALAEKSGVQIESSLSYFTLHDTIILHDGEFTFKDENGALHYNSLSDANFQYPLRILTLADYNAVTGESAALAPGEIMILTEKELSDKAAVRANGDVYTVKAVRSDTPFTVGKNSAVSRFVYFVARDLDEALTLRASVNPGYASDPYYDEYQGYLEIVLNYAGAQENSLAFGATLGKALYAPLHAQLGSDVTYYSSDINESRQNAYMIYGGLLFIGIFFAVLFLVNTVLIMYFKQVSEGYADRERFVILQKVGLSDAEVRSTINRQVLVVFFLPLAGALINVLAASNLINLILNLFVMNNLSVTLLCIAGTCVLFSLVYVLVFRATAKVYYKLVKW
ncbi:MAG: FtsX-like permease family protein [Oscillospiraceae bacterium]|nr:FtsX-like permease family protein [Oscillospiraceae bacterium]